MLRQFAVPVLVWQVLSTPTVVQAQTGKAPCGSFQKLSDGKWSVTKQIRIEHGNASTILNPGTLLGPGTRVAGADIYAELQRNCHGPQGAK
jgi:hypothetical protein